MNQDHIENLFVDANRRVVGNFRNFDDEINGYVRSMSNRMLFRIEDVFNYQRIPFNGGRIEDFLNENIRDEIMKIYRRKMTNAVETFANGLATLKNQVMDANDVASLNSCFALNEQIHADLRVQFSMNFERDFDFVSVLRQSNLFPEEVFYEMRPLLGRIIEDMEYEINSDIASVVKNSYFSFDECLNEKKNFINKESEKVNDNLQEENNVDKKYAPLDKVTIIEGDISSPDAKLMLANGEIMLLKDYLELFVLPYMDFDRNVQISDNEKLDLLSYFEKTLLYKENEIENVDEKASFR